MNTVPQKTPSSIHLVEMNDGSFDSRLKESLLTANAIKEMDFARAMRVRSEQPEDESLVSLLVRMGMVSERAMAQALSEVLGLKLIKAAEFPTEPVAEDKISYRFLSDQCLLPLVMEDGRITLIMADPTQEYAASAIAMACNAKVYRCVGVKDDIQQAVNRLYADVASKSDGQIDNPEDISDQDVAQLRDMASEAPVIRLVNQLVQHAVDYRASDIHVEPFEHQLKIRSRVDGVLRDDSTVPRQMGPAIISRIKIMANLDIAERRLPQDGRINLRIQGKELDIRVSTVPTMYGESVVMRLLQREAVSLDFDSLGFNEDLKRRLRHTLDMPYGMIIVTGPTGSGKTTTLYTALNSLNTVERKVITVEDPVEYNLEGINQIQVNPGIGLNFASALRSIVRQDPDVIMVGEMRDLETAKICVQSALTGHLVLSTLHTNDAAGSITRLLEMGVEDYLLNSTLNTVIAQRLVRVLCPECKRFYRPNEGQVREFGLDRLRPGENILLYKPKGCESCGGAGYKGRQAIIEMLNINDRIRDLIIQHAGAGKIEQAAREEGMLTMFEDGCLKVLDGITSLEEVVRVTQEA